MNATSLELAIDRHPQFVTPESPVSESLKIINRLFDPLCYGYVLVVSESFIQVNRTQKVPETAQKLPRRSQILGTVTAQDILRVTAEGKNLNNLTTAEVRTPEVECYPILLNQVFMNLLNNALDALEDRSQPQKITIKTSTFTVDSCPLEANGEQQVSTSYVIIAIADNGPGIATTVQTRIFEPFFTTKPVGKGRGLGLSVSYQIVVEKHHGRLEVISARGEGTEFMIEIPIKQQAGYESLLFND